MYYEPHVLQGALGLGNLCTVLCSKTGKGQLRPRAMNLPTDDLNPTWNINEAFFGLGMVVGCRSWLGHQTSIALESLDVS